MVRTHRVRVSCNVLPSKDKAACIKCIMQSGNSDMQWDLMHKHIKSKSDKIKLAEMLSNAYPSSSVFLFVLKVANNHCQQVCWHLHRRLKDILDPSITPLTTLIGILLHFYFTSLYDEYVYPGKIWTRRARRPTCWKSAKCLFGKKLSKNLKRLLCQIQLQFLYHLHTTKIIELKDD